ncbi:MAG: hypothetical protein HC883_04075 [Bdellovibrionaceae bacterium]|nr:hypothetical protein [Pseudobdellovibrionaceae bacterium]
MKPDLKAKLVYHLLWKPLKKWNLVRDLISNSRWQAADFICQTRKGKAQRQGKILCLFAHYDPEGLIRPFDAYHLEALKSDLRCDIAFCSTNIDFDNEANAEVVNRLTFLMISREIKVMISVLGKLCWISSVPISIRMIA